MTGVVKKKTDRGFGFISVEGQEKDLFFHSSALMGGLSFDSLEEGATVNFEVATGNDGRQSATSVTLAGEGAQSAPEAETPSEPVEEAVEQVEEVAPSEPTDEEAPVASEEPEE